MSGRFHMAVRYDPLGKGREHLCPRFERFVHCFMEEPGNDRNLLVLRIGAVEDQLAPFWVAEAVLFAVDDEQRKPQLARVVEAERRSFHVFGVEAGSDRRMDERVFRKAGDGGFVVGQFRRVDAV